MPHNSVYTLNNDKFFLPIYSDDLLRGIRSSESFTWHIIVLGKIVMVGRECKIALNVYC